MKFLIIDKSPDIRSSIKRIIDSDISGHLTVASSNYDEAFFSLYSINPDYIIIDPESLYSKGMMLLKSSLALLPPSRIFLFTELSTELIQEKFKEMGLINIYSKSKEAEKFIKEFSMVLSASIEPKIIDNLLTATN
ncbi:MAG: hypothetical protein R6W68_16150 [Ignavibacteriaceae bacterium]